MTKDGLILGIDPGLRITGYAILDSKHDTPTLIEGGVLRSRPGKSLDRRVAEIYEGLVEIMEQYHPAVMALEQLFSAPGHPRTAVLMGHVRGVICLAAAKAQVEVMHYTATRIKKLLTGNGRAPKSQVQHAIQSELHLDRLPEPPDVADALALALCHHRAGATAQRIDAAVRQAPRFSLAALVPVKE